MKLFNLLIAAIYIISCHGSIDLTSESFGIVRRTNNGSQQLRGNSNEEIGRVELVRLIDFWESLKMGVQLWFRGTNLPPNCTDSDDSSCKIILTDSPSCDFESFQKSKKIRQLHYITDHAGSTGTDTYLVHSFPAPAALSPMPTSIHFTDHNGAPVACAIIESYEDSQDDEEGDTYYHLHHITKKVGVNVETVRIPLGWEDLRKPSNNTLAAE